jgi:DNA-binding transcriptional MerR regulator
VGRSRHPHKAIKQFHKGEFLISIGEFSKATQLTIKTLRYYHDIGLLEPDKIDETTGYRYYSEKAFDKVRIILALKDMGFTLGEMKTIISQSKNEKDILYFIENKLSDVNDKLKELHTHKKRLTHFKELIAPEPRRRIEVRETETIPFIAAGIKMQGKYEEMANGFHKIMQHLGGKIRGKPFCLHFDLEYKEEGANFMPCFEVSSPINQPGITCLSVEPGKAVSLIHKGPYPAMGKTYFLLFQYIGEKGYKIKSPIMERYVKGPGIVFKGNPKNYVTEIVVFIE